MTLPKQNLHHKLQTQKQLVATTQQNPSTDSTQTDPMIARGLQRDQYIGIFSLAIAFIALVRAFSRRAEHTILFALFLSAILIFFLMTV